MLGKSVLCSTIIKETIEHCQGNGGFLAYFYFDFQEPAKQTPHNMLKSLVWQLACQSTPGEEEILSLYSFCNRGNRQPMDEEFLKILKAIIELHTDVYLILDALDECNQRVELLELIEEILSWKVGKLHFLATSRKELDIEEAFKYYLTPRQSMCIQSHLVDSDIRSYVGHQIRRDRRFRRWQSKPEVQIEIEESLMRKASGMYEALHPLALEEN
jgi:hypothetical protein